MVIRMDLGAQSYDITVERGSLSRAGEILNVRGRAVVVTDDGVPRRYAETVAESLGGSMIYTLPQGERTKCLAQYEKLLTFITERSLTRGDSVVAVGGGVVGDLSCFAASTYMRGIAFYNIPSTLLSQVDSSIGGKSGIDFAGYKNIVGTFYQPRGVLIDPELLSTLGARKTACGYAEAVKIALTSDSELFGIFERGEQDTRIDEVIIRSLNIKKSVVEQDEKEGGLRRVLNFGHTVGHAIESIEEMRGMYHGECVALGMIPMTAPPLRERLKRVLASLGLPTEYDYSSESIISALLHDKKAAEGGVTAVFVDTPGEFSLRRVTADEMRAILAEADKTEEKA